MKKIRKYSSNKYFISFMTFLVFTFTSFGNEIMQKNFFSSLNANSAYEYSGEELFKSIVFADGKFTDKLPSLSSISTIDTLKEEELVKYRAMENEAIEYLKKTDVKYFSKFQSAMYSKDPETISKSIQEIVTDLIPFINGKLKLQGLSIEKLESAVQKDSNGNIDLEKTESQMRQMCIVWVIGLAVVAVALVWVVAISAVAVVGNQIIGEGRTLSLEAISIQTAESL